jgi:hypothetical protein
MIVTAARRAAPAPIVGSTSRRAKVVEQEPGRLYVQPTQKKK